MKFLSCLTLMLLAVTLAFGLSRPWTPSDNMTTGIPAPDNVQVTVDKIAPGHLHLTFKAPNVKFEQVSANNRDWTRIYMDGETRRWEEGKPSVPVLSRPVLLPNTGNVQLKIVATEFTEYHNMSVLPQQPTPEDDGKGGYVTGQFVMDESCYKTDSWYPGNVAELNAPIVIRDARTAALYIQPVQVNPATQSVRVYTKIEVETVPIGGVGENEIISSQPHAAPGFAQYYDDILGADELEELNANALPGLMLVISRNDSEEVNILRPYVNWRNRSGRPTTLVTVAPTVSDPSAIQTIITNAYNTNNPPLEMVMLVGEGGTTGAYTMPTNNTNSTTDHTYGCVVGTDPVAEVYIGRWPAASSSELQLMVNRTLNYERSPAMGATGADTSWFRKGWGYAETEWPFNRDAVWYCLTQMNSAGIPWTGIWYDEHTGSANSATINSRCNPGLLFWAHRPSVVGEINSGFVSGVTQNINKCFVSVHVTCGSGEWYGTSANGTQKQLVKNGSPSQPAGAIASMATETVGTHSAPNCCILTGSYYALGSKQARHPAEMFFEGKYQIWRNYNSGSLTWAWEFIYWNNPMGDISANLWTGVPRRLVANIPQTIGLGQNRIEFTVTRQSDNVPMSGLLVTAMKTGSTGSTETYIRASTDVNGHVVLPLTNASAGNLYVTVVGNKAGVNVLPLIDTVTVIQLAADPAISSYAIIDSSGSGRVGNSNAMANPGETFDLGIKLQNLGSTSTVSGVQATLSTDDPNVIITNANLTYPDIAPGDSISSTGMYRIQLGGGLRENDNILCRLNITATDTTMNRILVVVIPVHSIKVSFISSVLNPATFNPGSGADVSVTVRNIGSLATGSITATLFSLSPYLVVNTSDATFTGLPIGTNVSNPTNQRFHITSNIRTMPGMIATLGVAFVQNAVRDTVYFSVTIGTRHTYDPTGPDSYGYLAYDDTDTSYEMHPTYSWQNIETTANHLNISDGGDGQDQSILVHLPFTAKYYGAYYDTITVCTNGWISFGAARIIDSTGTNTREVHLLKTGRVWRLPSNEGPRNMVAVGWQDLYISNMYAYNDTTNHWYIITWIGTWRGSGNNAYQILIYDPNYWPTYSGDCMLKFQYENYATGSAANEIGYATMGIQDSSCVRALEYSSGGTFSPGAATINQQAGVNRAVLYTTSQRFITGSLIGTVRRASDNHPVAGASVFVLNGGNSAVTDTNGNYTISDIQIGHYNVRTSGFGFNTKMDTVTIHEDTVSTLNFSLTAPSLRITLRPQDTTLAPNDSLFTSLYETGQDTALPIYIRNMGNGPLTWNSQLLYGGSYDETDSLWDQVYTFNASEAVGGDVNINGVLFDGRYFWVTGSNNYTFPHKLYKLDRLGTLIRSFNCPDVGAIGWRGLGWDGHYLYSSYSSFIDKIDTSNGSVVQRYQTNLNPVRAIAIDTLHGVLYYADQASQVNKMRLSDGASLGSLPNPSGTPPGGLYGLAWYETDSDSMKLYAFVRDQSGHSGGTRLYKMNTANGSVQSLHTMGLPTESAGGISITPRWNPMLWTVAAVFNNSSLGSTRIALFELAFNTIWIRFDPKVDTLQVGESDTVTVHLSSDFMPVDHYRVAIQFNTNSVTQTVTIPVVMNVIPVTSAPDALTALPRVYALEQNYPNPFNPTTRVTFELPKTSIVKLTVYNALGQTMARVITSQRFAAGKHTVEFDGSKWATGVYFYRIEADNFVAARKMVLMK